MPVLVWTFWRRELTLAPASIQTVECLGHSPATIPIVLLQILYPPLMLSYMEESLACQGICRP